MGVMINTCDMRLDDGLLYDERRMNMMFPVLWYTSMRIGVFELRPACGLAATAGISFQLYSEEQRI